MCPGLTELSAWTPAPGDGFGFDCPHAPHLAGEVLVGVRWEAGPRGLQAGSWIRIPGRAVGRGSVAELDSWGVAVGGHGWVKGFIGGGWDRGGLGPAPQRVWEKTLSQEPGGRGAPSHSKSPAQRDYCGLCKSLTPGFAWGSDG